MVYTMVLCDYSVFILAKIEHDGVLDCHGRRLRIICQGVYTAAGYVKDFGFAGAEEDGDMVGTRIDTCVIFSSNPA